MTSVGVIPYNKRTSFERGLLYTFRPSNKQLNHRFLLFVVSLQSKFYTLAPTFVFDVNIYFSTSRLLTIDPSLSLLQVITSTIFYFSTAFAVTLAWRYSCFTYVDFVKRVIIQASDIAKRLDNYILVILLKDRSN